MTRKQARTIDLSFLRDRKAQKRIAGITLAFAAAGFLYSLLGPRWYRSTVVLMPTKQQKSGISSLLGGDLGGLAAGLDVGGGGAETARIVAVLQSTAVTDAVIDKFDLRTRYREKKQEDARDELWRHCDVKGVTKPNLIQLSCEDKDPQFIQQLLTFFAAHGNEVFRRVNVSSASEEVRFGERRVAELRRQADEVATRMREFQEAHQIVDLDSQAKAVVSSVAMLNSQRIAKQMELDYARGFSSTDEAGARQLESQLMVVDDQLRGLEEPRERPPGAKAGSGSKKDRGPGMFPAALSVPKLRSEYEKLYRDRRVAEATLVFALDRLETARANEARDVSTFQVLDPATLPTKKSRPLGSVSVLVATVLGLVGSVLFEAWRGQRRSAVPASGE